MRKKQGWTDFCERYFGKSIMQDTFIKDINYVNCNKKNIFEGDIASSLMDHYHFLRKIIYTLRDGIQIDDA